MIVKVNNNSFDQYKKNQLTNIYRINFDYNQTTNNKYLHDNVSLNYNNTIIKRPYSGTGRITDNIIQKPKDLGKVWLPQRYPSIHENIAIQTVIQKHLTFLLNEQSPQQLETN